MEFENGIPTGFMNRLKSLALWRLVLDTMVFSTFPTCFFHKVLNLRWTESSLEPRVYEGTKDSSHDCTDRKDLENFLKRCPFFKQHTQIHVHHLEFLNWILMIAT